MYWTSRLALRATDLSGWLLRHREILLGSALSWLVQRLGAVFYGQDGKGARSLARGYFWLPCHGCGKWMSGEDWGGEVVGEFHNPDAFTVPQADGRGGHGICTDCTRAGVGKRAWAEWYAKNGDPWKEAR